MKKKILSVLLTVGMLCSLTVPATARTAQTDSSGITAVAVNSDDDGMNMYSNSDFIEKEQPELTEETKQLISVYQKNPTDENYQNLRNEVIKNYDAVLERKEAKLEELKLETAGKPGGEETVAEMEEIVQEMYVTYWERINSNMLRFTDSRLLKWKTADAAKYEYIPVMGAGESIYVKYSTVTNAEYAEYIKDTGAAAPSNWTGGLYTAGEAELPVNQISYLEAKAYCDWLTKKDGVNTYRLPTESEWELAAGHMPKDADFNCGINDGRTPVTQYAGVTRGAHGAIDFWGNVWEWTSTERDNNGGVTTLGVKGGSWSSPRTDCRTEYRDEGRDASKGYEDVGFRVIQVLNGIEPEKKVDLTKLEAPVVSATIVSDASVVLSWNAVDGAAQYQVFRYYEDTGLVSMAETTDKTSVTINNLELGKTYSYIVQPISYTAVCDNVSSEYAVKVTCGQAAEDATETLSLELCNYNGMNYWLYTPQNAENNMPMIVFLHGQFMGKTPDTFIETEGFAKWLNEGEFGNVSAYVLIPMLPSGQKDWISAKASVLSLIENVADEKMIDRSNISLTGFSMGGTGVWNIATSNPELFSRIAPCSGGVKATKKTVKNLSTLSIWAFTGSEDNMVNPQLTRDCAEALAKYDADIRVTEYEGAEHTDVESKAYLESEILEWLING